MQWEMAGQTDACPSQRSVPSARQTRKPHLECGGLPPLWKAGASSRTPHRLPHWRLAQSMWCGRPGCRHPSRRDARTTGGRDKAGRDERLLVQPLDMQWRGGCGRQECLPYLFGMQRTRRQIGSLRPFFSETHGSRIPLPLTDYMTPPHGAHGRSVGVGESESEFQSQTRPPAVRRPSCCGWMSHAPLPQVGRRSVKTAPLPGSLATAAVPPWMSAICLTIARPSPVPPSSRLRPLSTR